MNAALEHEMKLNSAKIRAVILRVMKRKNGGHLGGSMSIVETLSALYTKHIHYDLSNPKNSDRDYLVLSKGHAGPGLYAALSVFGFFPESDIYTMNEGGTYFPSHPDRLKTPGIDATTGSLGQGISVAAGLGMAFKFEKNKRHIYAIAGDGELNEGQCWEAFQFIANYKLNNVIVMIDENKRQLVGYTEDIMKPFDIAEKMSAFGFAVKTVRGNDETEISDAVDWAKNIKDSAVCIILDTVKGQGVRYFEEMVDNHAVKFKPEDIKALDKALTEIEALYPETRYTTEEK